MKVAWDARLIGGTSTGDSTYWTSLLAAMADRDIRLELVADQPPPPHVVIPGNATWHVLPGRSGRVWSLARFPAFVRSLGADLTHVQYAVSPLSRGPVVSTVHDVSFMIASEWFGLKDRALIRRGVQYACRRAQRVITVSETSRQEIERAFPGARGRVRTAHLACPPWIQPVPRTDAIQIVERKFGPGPYALTVGTRWPRKNMSLAVSAMDALPDTVPHRLLVTGKAGWGSQELGQRGHATGYVDEPTLSALYSAADLYLAPSRHEGFGLTLLEAFRCGAPVICGAGGAMPEVAGAAAIVAADYNVSTWVSRIAETLASPDTRTRLRDRGFARERDFSWDRCAEAHLAIYAEAIHA